MRAWHRACFLSGAVPDTITAYGVVARCLRPLDTREAERAVTELGARLFPRASIGTSEAVDGGSLVSGRRERFGFVDVSDGSRLFCLCRFRIFDGGLELVFNLSDSRRSAAEIDRYLTGRLPIELVRKELL